MCIKSVSNNRTKILAVKVQGQGKANSYGRKKPFLYLSGTRQIQNLTISTRTVS